MRKVITILMIIMMTIFVLYPMTCRANTIGEDKYAHAGASMAVGVLMAQNKPFNKWRPWQRVLFNVIVVGGAKEWYDSRHPNNHTAEWGDVAADAVGAMGAEGVVWLVHKTW